MERSVMVNQQVVIIRRIGSDIISSSPQELYFLMIQDLLLEIGLGIPGPGTLSPGYENFIPLVGIVS